ncbi:transposase family protein [Streptomyces sp. NPDC086549]|uniref:transposase family protein n=1 Tax=Streptomyces sp. NPDC086549 TaxID=3365752 RepID=UPI0037FA0E78
MTVPTVLRDDQRLADMAGGNDVYATTVRRWRDELIALLAPRAPRLDRALKKIAKRGGEVVLIDGTLIPTQRRTGKTNRPNYSAKHRRHGLHVLALTDERGRQMWISAARPGRTHDITAARRDPSPAHLRTAGLGALADLGFVGWTTMGTTLWSSPASRAPVPASSHPPTGRPPASWPPDAPPSNAASLI